MNKKKNKFRSLKIDYKKILERSFIVALLLVSLLFYVFPIFDVGKELKANFTPPIDTIKIPPTKHPEKRVKPKRPQIPAAADEDEMLDQVEIDYLVMQENWFNENPDKPTDNLIDTYEFYAVSEKPVLLNKVNPVYPELARKAGVMGMVVVKVLINTNGDIEDAIIMKSIPMLDSAALNAAKKFKFKPGKQRDRFVKVWMQIPFQFKMR